jgi:hypothetical protein
MVAMLLQLTLEIVAVAVVWKVAFWAFGDFVMEHLGVPFLDGPPRRPRGATRTAE